MDSHRYNGFHRDGYFKTRIDVNQKERQRALRYIEKSVEFAPIFAQVNGKMDSHRMQGTLKNEKPVRAIFQAIEFLLNQIFAPFVIREVVAIKSGANGPIQGIHRDMSLSDVREATEETGFPPIGIIFSLMPDTSLRVFNGCFGDTTDVDMKQKRDVKLDESECIVFRGDLAHCGLSYDIPNIRIHFIIGVDGFNWIANQTHPVIIQLYNCQYCDQAFEYLKYRNVHMKNCSSNPNGRSAEVFECHCGKKYNKKGSLYAHRKRTHPRSEIL